MELDIQIYHRDMVGGGPCYNYQYLMERLRGQVEYARAVQRRKEQTDAQMKGGGGGGPGGAAFRSFAKRSRLREAWV